MQHNLNLETHYNKVLDLSGLDVIGKISSVKIKDVVTALKDNYSRYDKQRQEILRLWIEYYINYLTNPESAKANLTAAARHIGKVQTTWRHNLKSPVAYQVVETLVSYFMGAFFPNDRWFNLKPESPIEDPRFREIIELNRMYLSQKFNDAGFNTQVEIALRECCIAGTSALMFPWKENNATFTALSVFDFLLDAENPKPNEANFIRPYTIHLAEALDYVSKGLFNLSTEDEVKKIATKNVRRDLNQDMLESINWMLGVNKTDFTTSYKNLEVYEFWGDLYLDEAILKNVRATWTKDGLLLNLDSNPYKEKPFVVLTYLELGKTPYGIGALQPVSSQIFYRDVLTSRMADNVAVSSDSVILYRQDAIIDPDDLVIRPGQKIPVTDPGGISALNVGGNVGVQIQDLTLIDQTVDRTIGTGAYIGVDRGRNADRVTAEEVAAQRDAGGKRLSTIYSNLNREFLLPVVRRFHYYCRMFEYETMVVSYGDTYIGINPQAIQYPFRVEAMGANNIADREYDIRQLLQWMEIVGQNEQLAQMVNWAEVMNHLTSLMVPSLVGSVIGGMPTPEMGPQEQIYDQLAQGAQATGGGPNVRRLQAAQMSGQLEQQLANQVQQIGGNTNVPAA